VTRKTFLLADVVFVGWCPSCGEYSCASIAPDVAGRCEHCIGGRKVAIRCEVAGYTCRCCGCDDLHACPEGCSWVEPDLCSTCADLRDRVLVLVDFGAAKREQLEEVLPEVEPIFLDQVLEAMVAERQLGVRGGRSFEVR
jgi:hypothetical protein